MTRRDLPTLLFLGLAVLFGLKSCSAAAAEASISLELDSLRSELLQARIDSAGWETRIAEETSGLELRLQESIDSTDVLSIANAELGAEVALLGGRIRNLQRVNARLEGRIATQAIVHSAPVENSARNTEPDSITASIDDGFLSGRVAYVPPENRFDLRYLAELELSLAVTELADGRQLVSAKSSDDRVHIQYDDVYVQVPDPVQYCSLGDRLWTSAVAVGSWELIQLGRDLRGGSR